jgi:hypothetical protein
MVDSAALFGLLATINAPAIRSTSIPADLAFKPGKRILLLRKIAAMRLVNEGHGVKGKWQSGYCFCGLSCKTPCLGMYRNLYDLLAKRIGEQFHFVVDADLSHKVEAM